MNRGLRIGSGLRLGGLGAFGIRGGTASSATYTINGTVYDADGSTAVQSATIALGAYSASSAANGTYTISDVPAATSGSMTCTKAGYSWAAISVAAMSGNLTAQNYTNAWWAAAGSAASCVRAYAPKGAANQTASYTNLVNPGTGDAAKETFTELPTWDATNGWKFNGTTQALTSGYVPTAAHSWIVKFSNGTGINIYVCGMFGGDNAQTGFLSYGSSAHAYRNGGSGSPVSDSFVTSGVVGAAGANGFLNGTKEVTNIGAWSGTGIAHHYGGRNRISQIDDWGACYIQAAAIYNAALSDAQMIAIGNALP